MADVSARPTAWSSGQTLPWQAHPHKAPALLDFFAPATLVFDQRAIIYCKSMSYVARTIAMSQVQGSLTLLP